MRSSLQFILIFSWIDMKPTQYGDYIYPEWATGVGWCLSLFSVSAIPIVLVYKVYHAKGPSVWEVIAFCESHNKATRAMIDAENENSRATDCGVGTEAASASNADALTEAHRLASAARRPVRSGQRVQLERRPQVADQRKASVNTRRISASNCHSCHHTKRLLFFSCAPPDLCCRSMTRQTATADFG